MMEYRQLGRTGLNVSRIAFGTLPFKIREFSDEEGAELLVAAAERGINFFDLGEVYDTYRHMRAALRQIRQPVVIASKSMAKDAESMNASIRKALDEIGVGRIDLFKMHSVDTLDDLEARRPAWEALQQAKADGLVGAIGVSTHSCRVMERIVGWPDVEVILAVLNREGNGICEGTVAEMYDLIKVAHASGKGIYLMKAFAGGLLFADGRKALEYQLGIPEADSMAVGMQNLNEVIFNIAVASGEEVPAEVRQAMDTRPRELHIRPFCKACGVCLDACRYGALTMGEKMPEVDREACILCGYCGFACPAAAIKII